MMMMMGERVATIAGLSYHASLRPLCSAHLQHQQPVSMMMVMTIMKIMIIFDDHENHDHFKIIVIVKKRTASKR